MNKTGEQEWWKQCKTKKNQCVRQANDKASVCSNPQCSAMHRGIKGKATIGILHQVVSDLWKIKAVSGMATAVINSPSDLIKATIPAQMGMQDVSRLLEETGSWWEHTLCSLMKWELVSMFTDHGFMSKETITQDKSNTSLLNGLYLSHLLLLLT